ncbi:hypothetical protein C8R47DRAFT_1220476 [Mycena vitilis]|nr:hypothetical protein C8R47DRAFT_1220476 [Mycena vitilis]
MDRAPLPRTNMTAQEMVPDTRPGRNPAFWCLPPVRDEPSDVQIGRYAMYLVTQGKKVGVWHNWTVVQTMVSGHPSGSQRGHSTMDGCVAEWQGHCSLGVHPHPAESPRSGATDREGALDDSALSDLASLTLGSDVSLASNVCSRPGSGSMTVTRWEAAAESARYYAIWGGRVVYADRAQAKTNFLWEEREGRKPLLLSTSDYDEAQVFSEAGYWISDDE